MKPRRFHPLQDPTTLPPLTLEDYEDFRLRLKNARIAVALLVLYSVFLAVTTNFLKLRPPIWLVLTMGFGLGIYAMYRLYSLKCPRCGTVPMTNRVSLLSGEVESGSFVALNPKKCQKCDALLSTKPAG